MLKSEISKKIVVSNLSCYLILHNHPHVQIGFDTAAANSPVRMYVTDLTASQETQSVGVSIRDKRLFDHGIPVTAHLDSILTRKVLPDDVLPNQLRTTLPQQGRMGQGIPAVIMYPYDSWPYDMWVTWVYWHEDDPEGTKLNITGLNLTQTALWMEIPGYWRLEITIFNGVDDLTMSLPERIEMIPLRNLTLTAEYPWNGDEAKIHYPELESMNLNLTLANYDIEFKVFYGEGLETHHEITIVNEDTGAIHEQFIINATSFIRQLPQARYSIGIEELESAGTLYDNITLNVVNKIPFTEIQEAGLTLNAHELGQFRIDMATANSMYDCAVVDWGDDGPKTKLVFGF